MSPRHAFAFSLSSSAPLSLEDGKSDAWVEIAKLGEWKGYVDPGGKRRTVKITPAHFASALAEFARCENEMVLDYEHQSTTGEEAPAAGWIDALKVDGDKLTAHVTFTARAAEKVRAKEYRYTSPVWSIDAPDRVTGETLLAQIPCVALTNVPFQDGLRPVALSRAVRMAQAIDTNADAPGGTMTPDETKALLDSVMAALGVTDPATLLAAVTQLVAEDVGELEAPASVPAAMSRLKASTAALANARVELGATKGALDVAMGRLTALESAAAADALARAESAAASKVDALISSGRAVPSQRDGLVGFARSLPAEFDAFAAGLSALVPMTRQALKSEARTASIDTTDPIVASFKRAGWSDEKIAAAIAKHGQKS